MSKTEKGNNQEIHNFRELVERYKNFDNNIAFKYKQKGKLIEITYQQYRQDIKALRNSHFKFRH